MKWEQEGSGRAGGVEREGASDVEAEFSVSLKRGLAPPNLN